jgi:hypothetical protein
MPKTFQFQVLQAIHNNKPVSTVCCPDSSKKHGHATGTANA